MADNQNKIPDDTIEHLVSKNSINQDLYTDIESYGFKYINHQKNYLITTAVFPIFALFVQVFNLIHTIGQINRPPPEQIPLPPLHPQNIYNILAPIIIFIIIASFALVKFVFLYIWMKKVHRYEIQQKLITKLNKNTVENSDDYSDIQNSIGLTQIFYDIVDHMQLIRIVFILMNIAFIFYIQWTLTFLLSFFGIIPRLNQNPSNYFHYINIIAEFGLLFYMVFEWKHFLKWNRKLKKINELEKKIYAELEM
ncbi:hypothetical protein NEF87_000434 [Candidatus Lokiarchaeum ossiferum]|uniref:DUF4234 domain-containing protein n=1 Tax=Candidatus Lokiarchaeum ossiferum TaxID=2951803 RepID=A0ABY6HNK4_9ARCH|nr:hypothetical protein NEF87_000434 [Candidatus Lokiarchaeum sp. B-35]